jgi:uncharacterized membrane protein YgdD (TMEM256/DUF423 family)
MNWIGLGASSAGLAVVLGAFGAHALKERLDDYSRDIYHTAFEYQALHAVALILFGLYVQSRSEAVSSVPGWLFALGTLFFSGSLYLLAVSGMKWLGAITPIGGALWIAAWAWVAVIAFKNGGAS